MRVIFFGTSAFAVPSLESLGAHGHTVVMCVTQPDRPQGRGLGVEPSPVKRAALRLGMPLSQPDRLAGCAFATLRADVGVVAAYGRLIKRDVLSLPAHGMVGVHPSLLPKYRGAAPVAHAILSGEDTTGVSIFRLNEALDAGEIICQEAVSIGPEETAEALTERLARLGAQVLVRALALLETGQAMLTTQDEAQASLAPKLTKSQGLVHWQESAQAIARVVRATIPWPGATTEWAGAPLRIWAASVREGASAPSGVAPGSVVDVAADAIQVAAGAGVLAITELQPANRRRMSVRDFLAGHAIRVGDRFGGRT